MDKKLNKERIIRFTISVIRKAPVAKTRALGGVATGSMKANDAEAQTGSIRYSGFI